MNALQTPTLPGGTWLPRVGHGTYSLDGADGAASVAAALRGGYRLLDTALGYGNEAAVGAGLRDSGVPRKSVVVTTKLPDGDHGYDRTLAAFDVSADRLGLETIDLYLIHWPVPEQDRYVDSWRAMMRLRDEGRIRDIGVSNFDAAQLQRLERETGELPAVNQVDLQVGNDQQELRRFHDAHGIVTESYSPLKHGRALAADPTLDRLARAHGVRWNQVVLRWNLQLGTVVIPRSKDPERQATNLDVAGFALDELEMAEVGALRP